MRRSRPSEGEGGTLTTYAGLFIFYAVAVFSTELLLNQGPPMIRPFFLFGLFFALAFLSLILHGVTGSVFFAGFLPTLLLLVFYGANYYRTSMTGSVLVPSDLALAPQLGELLAFTVLSPKARVIEAALLMLLDWAALYRLSRPLQRRVGVSREDRLRTFSGGLLLSVLLVFALSRLMSYDPALPATLFYKKHGAAIGFAALLAGGGARQPDLTPLTAPEGETPPPPPDGETGDYIGDWAFRSYSQETMEEIVSAIRAGAAGENDAGKARPGAEKPDIVVIMSEAFFDMTQLPSLHFSEDPLRFFHSMQSLPETTAGHILTPVFGGQTCNPEYEFLTGNLMRNVTMGDTPYLQYRRYIRENDPKSLAALLSRQGYHTVGLHTYTGRFYDRSAIYERLGFDMFLSAEDMPDAEMSGGFISDAYFAQAIIRRLEAADEPLFLFGISMENHYEYEHWKYGGSTDIEVESDRIDGALLEGATVLAQGLKNADKSLEMLVSYLAQSDRPTLLFFFGDHLPLVGQTALEFYQALGYVEAESLHTLPLDEARKLYATPYLLWANYEREDAGYGDMSPAFIGSVLIEQAGLLDSVYTRFLRDAYAHFHGATTTLYLDATDGAHAEPTPEMLAALQIQALLQYDYTDGNGYVNKKQTELLLPE